MLCLSCRFVLSLCIIPWERDVYGTMPNSQRVTSTIRAMHGMEHIIVWELWQLSWCEIVLCIPTTHIDPSNKNTHVIVWHKQDTSKPLKVDLAEHIKERRNLSKVDFCKTLQNWRLFSLIDDQLWVATSDWVRPILTVYLLIFPNVQLKWFELDIRNKYLFPTVQLKWFELDLQNKSLQK